MTVTDVKQFAYCPRIPYYRYVLPVRSRNTYPMERGKEVQAAVEALERRRGFRRYGVAGSRRRFGLALRSAQLGLAGRLDLLIETEEGRFQGHRGPCPAKPSHPARRRCDPRGDCFRRAVPAGFVYRVPSEDLVAVELREGDRAFARQAIAGLRRAVLTEAIPDPTDVRKRCGACEFRNYCGDIW